MADDHYPYRRSIAFASTSITRNLRRSTSARSFSRSAARLLDLRGVHIGPLLGEIFKITEWISKSLHARDPRDRNDAR